MKEVRSAARTVASLDKPVADDSDTAFGDLVAQDSGNVEEEVVLALGDDALHRAIEALPEREQLVIKLRYGLDGDQDPKSLEVIGGRLGITRERVRQIEMQALGAARRAARDRSLVTSALSPSGATRRGPGPPSFRQPGAPLSPGYVSPSGERACLPTTAGRRGPCRRG